MQRIKKIQLIMRRKKNQSIQTHLEITQLTEFIVGEKHNYNLTGYVQETRRLRNMSKVNV